MVVYIRAAEVEEKAKVNLGYIENPDSKRKKSRNLDFIKVYTQLWCKWVMSFSKYHERKQGREKEKQEDDLKGNGRLPEGAVWAVRNPEVSCRMESCSRVKHRALGHANVLGPGGGRNVSINRGIDQNGYASSCET